jgi:hypothetical protein
MLKSVMVALGDTLASNVLNFGWAMVGAAEWRIDD